ncbi:MAG: hypothetical protein M3033_19575 [Acidobacteriota bacterium]|nr:hypothetical protein [Acidobacteriota bacterium]
MNLWTLNKLIVLVLIAAFVFLLFEIRMEHQDVLGEFKIAWIPILYSGLMIIAGFAALFFWNRGGRQILFCAFAAALIVGAVGFWQHNEQNFGRRISFIFTVWGDSTSKKQSSGKDESSAAGNQDQQPNGSREIKVPVIPPILAPLTFAGLGILGMFACARRFQREIALTKE